MNQLFMDPQFCIRWSIALLHSLWEGLGILGFSFLMNWFLRKSTSNQRYVSLLLGQAAIVLSLPVTYLVLSLGPTPSANLNYFKSSQPVVAREAIKSSKNGDVPVGSIPGAIGSSVKGHGSNIESGRPTWYPFIIVIGYLLGSGLMLMRLVAGLFGGKRLVARSRPIGEIHVLKTIARAVSKMEFSYTPAIAYCSSVVVPSVVGVLRPTLILPFAVATGLSPYELELLVMHELAHIRRYDHFINLVQRLADAFVFYNPASWYLARRIRHERELCCDDLVIGAGGHRRHYAQSLVRMAELVTADPLTSLGLVQLAATGQTSRLRERVMRLLHPKAKSTVRLKEFAAIGVGFGSLLLFLAPVTLAMRVHRDVLVPENANSLAEQLRRNPESINDRTDRALTRLHLAILNNKLDDVRTLLLLNADPNAREGHGWTPMHFAAALNRQDMIQLLLDAKADINAQNHDGDSPLHLSLGMGNPAAVTIQSTADAAVAHLLIQRGAMIDVKDGTGATPLFGAVWSQHYSVIDELLERGASVETRNHDNQTPLFIACELADDQVISVLLGRGADAKVIDSNGWNLLDSLVLRARGIPLPRQKVMSCAQILLDRGVEPEISAAAALGLNQLVIPVLEKNPGIMNAKLSKTINNYNLLHWAVLADDLELCRYLVAHGVNVNATTSYSRNPLHLAVSQYDPDARLVRMLLDAGITSNSKDKAGGTVLHEAVKRANPEIIEMLLKSGEDPNLPDNEMTTPLHVISILGSREPIDRSSRIAELLLSNRAKVDALNRSGKTALQLAASVSDVRLVAIFLAHGADPNRADAGGLTALHLAIMAKNPAIEVVQLLISHGADSQLKNRMGQSSLDLAETVGRDDIIHAITGRQLAQH